MEATATIRFLTGARRGRDEAIDASEISFGTGPGNTVRFDPAWDRSVSPSQARATRDASGTWWIEDAGSSSGTFVNGKRVTARSRIDGPTVIELGRGGVKIELVPAGRAAGSSPSRRPQGRGLGLAAAALVAIVGLAAWWFISSRPGAEAHSDSDEKLRLMAEKYAGAVGVVTAVIDTGPMPFGTAWAVEEDLFATNAHVANMIPQLREDAAKIGKQIDFYILINGHPESRHLITGYELHPKAFDPTLNPQGRKPAIETYDVAVLQIDGRVPTHFPVASKAKLHALGSGTRVAFLGFPSENLVGGGVNAFEPVANMQSGIVTSVSDYWLGKATPESCYLVSHNLAATGGASGSPVFDSDGDVIGLLSAGNTIGAIWGFSADGTPEINRAPSAALINFAQRADLLTDLLQLHAAKN